MEGFCNPVIAAKGGISRNWASKVQLTGLVREWLIDRPMAAC